MAERALTVRIIGDDESLRRAFRRSSAGTAKLEHDLTRTFRGVAAGSGVFRSLGRSIAFASASFLGGAGLTFAFTDTIKKAEESQRVVGQTENAVRQAGLSWRRFGGEIQQAALKLSNLSGFDDERLLGTFSNLVRRTHDVNRALELNALAADIARARNISLEQAQSIVIRASLGMSGALRRIGIEAKKGSTGLQLIDQLQRQFSGSAAAYGRTAVGAQDRFRVAIENTQEALGKGILPVLTEYLNKGSDWLSQTKNQERLQHDASEAVKQTSAIIKETASVVHDVTDAVGGWKNALEILIAVKVASTIFRWTGNIADLVDRMRVAKTETTGLGTRLRALPAATTVGLLVAVDLTETSSFKNFRSWLNAHTADIPEHISNFLTSPFGLLGNPQQIPKVKVPSKIELDQAAIDLGITNETPFLDALTGKLRKKFEDEFAKAAARAGAQPITLQGRFNLAELALAQAEVGGNDQAIRRQLVNEAAILEKQIASAKTLKLKTQLTQQLAGIEGQIRSIDQQAAADAKQAADARKQAAKAAADQLKQAREAAALARATRQFRALGLGPGGEVLGPTTQTLRNELANVQAAIRGTIFDTRPNENMLARVRKVLSGELGSLNRDVRLKIQEMIGTLKRELGKADAPLTKFRHAHTSDIVAGLGLTPDQVRAVRSRLAQLGPNGVISTQRRGALGFPVPAGAGDGMVFTGDIHIHGVQDTKQLRDALQRKARRGTAQSRGRHPGINVGAS